MNELEHYGIDGQKWGIRRFQYEDGTLTPEGKKRYGAGSGIKGFIESSNRKTYAKRFNSTSKMIKKMDEKEKKQTITRILDKKADKVLQGKYDIDKFADKYNAQIKNMASTYIMSSAINASIMSGAKTSTDIYKRYGDLGFNVGASISAYHKAIKEQGAVGDKIKDSRITKASDELKRAKKDIKDVLTNPKGFNMSDADAEKTMKMMSTFDSMLNETFGEHVSK